MTDRFNQGGTPFTGIHSSPPVPYGVAKGDTLGRGRPLGKATNVYVEAGRVGAHPAPATILEVTPDGDPRQLSLTLNPPKGYDVTGQEAQWRNNADAFTGPFLENTDQTLAGNYIFFPEAFAIIEWGAGGLNNKAEADFSNGLCVNLVANFVRVRAQILEPIGGGPISTVYQFSAFIGEGRPKTTNAQRTITVQSAANTETAGIAIPRYAKTVLLCGTNPTFDDYTGTIKFYNSINTASATPIASFKFTNAGTPQPVRIPQGAYFFTVTSALPNTTNNRAIFDLSI